jgi:hypothetical protein
MNLGCNHSLSLNKSIKSQKGEQLTNCENEIESLLTTLNNQVRDNNVKNIVDELKDKLDCIRTIQSDCVTDEKMSFN